MSKINVQNKIKSNFNYLEQLIKYADNHNIKVILVSTPTTNLYKNYVTSTAQYFNLVRNTRKLKNKYKNVIWLNYLENNEDFELSDFKDSDHLSAKGANKLSEKINNILKSKAIN